MIWRRCDEQQADLRSLLRINIRQCGHLALPCRVNVLTGNYRTTRDYECAPRLEMPVELKGTDLRRADRSAQDIHKRAMAAHRPHRPRHTLRSIGLVPYLVYWRIPPDSLALCRPYGGPVQRLRRTGRGGDRHAGQGRAVAGKLSAAQVASRPRADVPCCCIHENARKRPMTWTTPTLVEICHRTLRSTAICRLSSDPQALWLKLPVGHKAGGLRFFRPSDEDGLMVHWSDRRPRAGLMGVEMRTPSEGGAASGVENLGSRSGRTVMRGGITAKSATARRPAPCALFLFSSLTNRATARTKATASAERRPGAPTQPTDEQQRNRIGTHGQ